MGCENWLKTRVDQIVAAGSVSHEEWRELFERGWDDGMSSPDEAAEMGRLLAAMNDGTVKSVR